MSKPAKEDIQDPIVDEGEESDEYDVEVRVCAPIPLRGDFLITHVTKQLNCRMIAEITMMRMKMTTRPKKKKKKKKKKKRCVTVLKGIVRGFH